MLYEIFIGLISLIGLLAGAEVVIDRARSISQKLKISGFFIGLTLFSIGTSLPELTAHIIASIDILRGEDYNILSNLVVGMSIGSDIIQITLIIGIVSLFGILKLKKGFLKVDYSLMLFSIPLVFLFALDGIISRFEGFILLLIYAIYVYHLAKTEKFNMKLIQSTKSIENRTNLYIDTIIMFGGLALLLLSADRLAFIAEFFSQKYLISSSVFGSLIVGLSTSLPELTTSILAIKKKNSGISLGTLIGSNITNPLMGIGLGALISTYSVENKIIFFDLPFNFLVSLIPLIFFLKWKKIDRVHGIILIFFYLLYVILRIHFI